MPIDYRARIQQSVEKARKGIKGYNEKTIEYLTEHDKDVRRYFSSDVPPEQQQRFRSMLEEKVGSSLAKYDEQLHGIGRKLTKRGAMGIAVVNDVSAYLSRVPLLNAASFGYLLFGISTLAELPALYRYLKKSHDWYGALGHIALKPVRYLLPVVGPALEAGAFERMVKRRATREAKTAFLKEMGVYEPINERVKGKLRMPIGSVLQPMPA
ncbi:MAG TPA: hypothetical protein VJK03_02035 [Candidatus Nanoarchaeia archaeon]|nr:hypothetical protein [Candidatus Nanoarchaeia archaeon]